MESQRKWWKEPSLWAASLAALLSLWGVKVGEDTKTQLQRYERSKEIAEMVDQNIDDLLDADETKGNLTFLALYFLAEEDDRKLYFTKIATKSELLYIADTVAELLNDDFYPYSRKDFDCDAKRLFPIDTRKCNKVKEALNSLAKLKTPQKAQKIEEELKSSAVKLSKSEVQTIAKTAAAQGLIDTPATKTEIVLEQREKQPDTASWVYLGMSAKEETGAPLQGTVTTNSSAVPDSTLEPVVVTTTSVVARPYSTSSKGSPMGVITDGKSLRVCELKFNRLKNNLFGVWAKVVRDSGDGDSACPG